MRLTAAPARPVSHHIRAGPCNLADSLRAQASLSATNYYAGMYPRDEYGGFVTKGSALETRMMAARGSAYRGRRSKPPDLASKLLDARIVYVGMPVSCLAGCIAQCEHAAAKLHKWRWDQQHSLAERWICAGKQRGLLTARTFMLLCYRTDAGLAASQLPTSMPVCDCLAAYLTGHFCCSSRPRSQSWSWPSCSSCPSTAPTSRSTCTSTPLARRRPTSRYVS